MPVISVILPTYNRLGQLQLVLAGLERQTFPLDQFEVLVISDGSTDGTLEYLRRLQTPLDLRFYTQPNQGAAAARNCGIEHARGEVLLFIDDDVVPTAGLIEEHLRTHAEQQSPVVVIGPMLTPEGYAMAPWVRWEQEHLFRQYQEMNASKWESTARQFYTGNSSLARRHFDDMPGFDPAFRRAEDVELGYRLADRGVKFIFNPNAIGYHYAERSFTSWIGIAGAYGRNDVTFSIEKGQGWLLPRIGREYHTRHALVRGLTRLCAGRPALIRLCTALLSASLHLGTVLHAPGIENMACSGMFNLLYYQGIVEQLQGRDRFFALVDHEQG